MEEFNFGFTGCLVQLLSCWFDWCSFEECK